MSSYEFSEWLEYNELSPIDARWRHDLTSAQIAALIAETNRDKGHRAEPFTPDDFLPRFGEVGDEADATSGGDDESDEPDGDTTDYEQERAEAEARVLFAKVSAIRGGIA